MTAAPYVDGRIIREHTLVSSLKALAALSSGVGFRPRGLSNPRLIV